MAVGRRAGGGISAPLASGAVAVAPDALCPARAGHVASGGLARREGERPLTPAAERSRAAPTPVPGRAWGGRGGQGPGPSPQGRRCLRRAVPGMVGHVRKSASNAATP